MILNFFQPKPKRNTEKIRLKFIALNFVPCTTPWPRGRPNSCWSSFALYRAKRYDTAVTWGSVAGNNLMHCSGGRSAYARNRFRWNASRIRCRDTNGRHQSWLWQLCRHPPYLLRRVRHFTLIKLDVEC